MTPKQTLIAARALIEKPEHWIKGQVAGDDEGRWVYPKDKEATCWCTAGAIDRCTRMHSDTYWECLAALDKAINDDAIEYNDTHTHAEVLAMFDLAIGACDD